VRCADAAGASVSEAVGAPAAWESLRRIRTRARPLERRRHHAGRDKAYPAPARLLVDAARAERDRVEQRAEAQPDIGMPLSSVPVRRPQDQMSGQPPLTGSTPTLTRASIGSAARPMCSSADARSRLCSKQYPPRRRAASFHSRSACSSETGMPRWESRFSNGIVVACARVAAEHDHIRAA
jgi:hypothetical protein